MMAHHTGLSLDEIDLPTNRHLERNGLFFQFQKKSTSGNWNVHSHEGYEIFFFQQGKASFVVGDRVYPLTVGDMLLIPGDVLHIAKPDFKHRYTRSVINFLPDYLRYLPADHLDEIVGLFNREGGLLIHWDAADKCEIERLLGRIQMELQNADIGHEVMIHNYLVQLLFKVYRKVRSHNFNSAYGTLTQREQHVENILAVINKTYDENLKLDDISNQVNLNKHYICHCFKEVTGFTISQYVSKRRVDEARKLLKSTNKSIGCIGTMVGIENVSQFSRMFKEHVGVSPFVYRKMYLKQL